MKRPLRNITQFTRTFAGMLPIIYPQPAHDVEATETARLMRAEAQLDAAMFDALTEEIMSAPAEVAT